MKNMKIHKTVGSLLLLAMLLVYSSCNKGPEPSGFSQAQQNCCNPAFPEECTQIGEDLRGVCVTIRLNARAKPGSYVGVNLSIGESVTSPSAISATSNASDNGTAQLQLPELCVKCSDINNYEVKMTAFFYGEGGTTTKTYKVPITQAVFDNCCR